MEKKTDSYAGYRYPTEIIRHAVWLYFRFTPGFRDVEDILVPRVLVTDKLKSYGAAKREVMPGVEHRQHQGLNNRAEVSHQPTRQQERQRRRFKSPGQAQRFLSAHGPIGNLFRIRHRHPTAADYRAARCQAFATWREATSAHKAA